MKYGKVVSDMARPIDADKFIKQFERALEHQQKYGLYNHAKLTEYVIKAIENEPTADVVPKSEVKWLESEVDRLLLLVDYNHSVLEQEVQDAKAEVAREIWEQIDVTWSERGCVSEFFENLAELKKKYTEGVDGTGQSKDN